MTDEVTKATSATDGSAPGSPDKRSQRAQVRSGERLATALAMIAGFIDAYGFVSYGVYVSFMSGNTT